MVEGELRQLIGREPAHILTLGCQVGFLGAHERPVDDGHDTLARRAVDVAEGVELFEVVGLECRRLAQVARCCRGEAFPRLDRAAGERPPAVEWGTDAADQWQAK